MKNIHLQLRNLIGQIESVMILYKGKKSVKTLKFKHLENKALYGSQHFMVVNIHLHSITKII